MNFLKNLKNKIRLNILLCFICVYLTNYLKQILFKIKNEGTFLNVSYLLILIITTFVLCETYYYTISHYPSFLGTVDLISTLDSFYTTYTSTKDGIIYFYATNYIYIKSYSLFNVFNCYKRLCTSLSIRFSN